MATQKIVIGIDFGTTYSGVAWADSYIPNEINPIRNWPGSGGIMSDKIASSMLYLPDGTFKWGNNASGGLQFMKLLLDPSQEKNSSLADPLGLVEILAALPQNKKPVDAVADYLRAIKAHALEELSRNRGQEFWKFIVLEYHLTIPAVWSESARALTLKAANQAGIGSDKDQDLILIPEPEAAALYCLTTLPNLLNAGDVFIVVDCGGGTVDLVSYKVLARDPKLEVTEVAVGGGLCGSVFLNRRFEMMVRKRLGATLFDSWVKKPNGKKHYDRMMSDFDGRLKRKFDGSYQDDLIEVEVPGLQNDPSKGVIDGYMDISLEDLQGIFKPVIKEILRLIQEQIDKVNEANKLVSSIIMVGGFGSSTYLHKQVEELANTQRDKLTPNFEVLCPKDAWSAVVRGAVITGLKSVEIQSRQARRNYGVDFCTKFEPFKHQEFSPFQFWNKYHQCFYIGGCVKWYVKKGDEIVGDKEISFPFSKPYDNQQSDMKTEMELWASDSAHAEEHVSHEKVYKVCKIEVDLSPLRGSLRPTKNSQGDSYYMLSFSIIMNIHSAQLTFGVKNDEGVPFIATTIVTFI